MVKNKGNCFKKKSNTLCWDCANACGGCCWSKSFKPVEGWEATPTKVYQTEGKYSDSFEVHSCPLFKKDILTNSVKITINELAQKLGVSTKTLHRMFSNDIIKKARKYGINLDIIYIEKNREFFVQKSVNASFIPNEFLKAFFGKNKGYTGF